MNHIYTLLLRLALLLSLFNGSPVLAQSAQRYTLSGTIADSLSGETLIGSTVMLSGAQSTGVSANEYGFYSNVNPAVDHPRLGLLPMLDVEGVVTLGAAAQVHQHLAVEVLQGGLGALCHCLTRGYQRAEEEQCGDRFHE